MSACSAVLLGRMCRPAVLVLLPTRHPHAWQTAAAGCLDASSAGACWWCWEAGHREADCPRKAEGGPARSDVTAGELQTAHAKIRELQGQLQDLQEAHTELDLGYSIEKGKREAPSPADPRKAGRVFTVFFSLRSLSKP